MPVFEAMVEQCQQAGLVWGRELYLDGTQVNANADLDSLTPRFTVEVREAMQVHLAALFSDEETQQEIAKSTAAVPTSEGPSEGITPSRPPLPVALTEPEREELAAENAARHDWIAEQGKPQREVHGLYQRTAGFKISTTDPNEPQKWRHAFGIPGALRRRWWQSRLQQRINSILKALLSRSPWHQSR